MINTKITGAIFDMDGLIFDSERVWQRAFVEANKKFNTELTEEYRCGISGKSEQSIRAGLRVLCPSLDADAYRDFMIERVNADIEKGNFDIKKGFISIVKYFKEKGVKTALATAGQRERTEKMFAVKGLEINELFDAAVCADDVAGHSKPDPFVFLRAAEKSGMTVKNTVVMEDSVNGITAAVNGGFIPVMVPDLVPCDGYCKEHCALIVETLADFLNIIKENKLCD